jgi:hypothetical protein
MRFARWIWHWCVQLSIAAARKEERRRKKIERAMKWLGIPMPPRPKTQREMFVRSLILWSGLAIAFGAAYWALS